MTFVRWIALGSTTLLLFSCVSTSLPPISSAGAAFQPLGDEIELWDEAFDEEQAILGVANIYQDPHLVDYLEGVVARLTPPGMAENPQIEYQVTVLEEPTLNAFAFPHGSLYIHTGLLARMENEDQLAAVLGHEMSHVEYRHLLRQRRSAHNKQLGWAALAVAASVIIANQYGDYWDRDDYHRSILVDVLISLGLEVAYTASVNGYGRQLEVEADQGGLNKMVAADYDPREAPKIYQALLDGHGENSDLEVFFFGSHPQLSRRIANAETFATRYGAESEPSESSAVRQEEFQQQILPVVRQDALANIRLGRLELAEKEIVRVLEALPQDPESHFLLSHLRLSQADVEQEQTRRAALEEEARRALRETIRLMPEHGPAHRELGILAYDAGDFATACVELRLYTELEPQAEDTPELLDELWHLDREGHCPG